MSSSTNQPTPARSRARTRGWRVVDIVIASVLAVACGVLFWIWSNAVAPAVTAATIGMPPLAGLAGGGWLFAGVLGGLVIRKPGAAVYCEVVAAVIEALLGTHYNATVLLSGLVQGIGAELGFLLFAYRRFTMPVAVISGLLSGLALAVSENLLYNRLWAMEYQLIYVVCAVVSGVVVAGILAWLLTRALVATGVLNSVAAGRDARRGTRSGAAAS